MNFHDFPVLAGTVSTLLFVVSYLPMLVKAFRTRDLESYSLSNLLIANVGNGVHSIYVYSLPMGPIWFLHGFYVVSTAVMLLWHRLYVGRHPREEKPPGTPRARSRLSGMTDALISSAYSQALEVIASVEPRIAEATRQELTDQRGSLKLIASENYASPAVLLTMGTWFSDKYAEGTIGHRFYAGCQNVDTVESIAAEHARELFGAPYAYVQPHSGIDANLVGYWSILAHRVETPALEKLGAKNVNELTDDDWESVRHELGNQRLLGMSLDSGGHLTHGFRPNISGKMFHQQQYGTDPETGLLDYDKVAAKAREFKPLVLVAGYSAYPRRVNFAKMREIADEVGATLMVDMAHFAGLVAGKVFTGDEDPGPVRAHHHDDDAQVAARPARRHGAGPGGVRGRRRPRLPDGPGRPAVAHDGGEGGRAGRGPDRRVPHLRAEHRRQRQVAGRGLPDPRRQAGHRRHRQPHRAARRLVVRAHRPPGRDRPARRGRRHQPQLGPVRPERRLVHLRHPARYSRAHDARLRARRVRQRGRADRARPLEHPARHDQGGQPSKASYSLAEGVAEKVKAASAEMLDKYPLYPGLELS